MNINKKTFCILIILIFCLGVSSVSATNNGSDIIASDDNAIDLESIGGTSLNKNLDDESTFVITNETFADYFTAEGKLNNKVGAGSTLDFQGTFTGEAYKVNITKPVNIISSTEDGLFNEIGEKASTGGCFHISTGGSGTNISGIEFINSAFYVTNASDVSIENIHMMADISGVGSGTGFMCVQAGSRYVTIKDSYFKNSGTGSSIVVFGYADFCTFDNNEVVINGSSGNAVYITTSVPDKYTGSAPTGNIISNNYIHGEASPSCMALVITGNNNDINNNLIKYNGACGIACQSFSTTENNTYTDNVLTGGCSFTAGDNSNVSGNIVEGTMSAGSQSTIIDNKMDALSLSKPNVFVDDNIIGKKQVTLEEAALNTTLTNNIIFSKVNVKSNNNTIKNNTIEVDDEYAIDLYKTTGNVVAYNNLVSNSFAGDAAVNGSENNYVYENSDIGNIVIEDNFFTFFDKNGTYIRNYTELFFMGKFDSLVDAITINQSLSIKGMDANLKNMAFILLGDDICLNGLQLELFKAPVSSNASAILINGAGITIENMNIEYALNEISDAYVIYAENANNLEILNNNIYFDGMTNNSKINNAVYVSNSSDVLFEGNNMNCFLTSCYVSWKEIPPSSGNWVKFPSSEGIVFDRCSALEILNNNIHVGYNDVVGEYDTIYVMDIKDCQDVNFSSNVVTAFGHSYIYGLYVEADGLLIDNNNFTVVSDENYANGIEIEASSNAVISYNHLDITAPVVAYPIYSGMNGGDLEVDYIRNKIKATSDIVYGMELCGTKEFLTENTITVNGNKTTALAIKSKEVEIFNNIIVALGENLGNSTTTDLFVPMTATIHLMNSSATIYSNDIASTSIGILVENGKAEFGSNFITIKNNGLDDSYAIMAENASILISGCDIIYEGNGNGFKKNRVVYLKDCIEPELIFNHFDIALPSGYVDWKEEPPGSGNWVSNPMSEGILIDSPNATVEHNNILSNYEGIFGDYDTIYVVHVNSENAQINSNIIQAYGHSYIYALEVSGNNFTVDDNIIYLEADNFYTNGIDVEGPARGKISNNEIICEAPGVTYPVYSAMSNGDVIVDYINNTIISISNIGYGMELGGFREHIEGNFINITAKEGIGIYSRSQDANVNNNKIVIETTDENVTNSTAFKGRSGNATITNNNITVDGEYAIDVVNIVALVKDNYLIATNLTGDAAVNYNPETSSVYNNTPKMEKYFLTTDGLEKYYGNDKDLEFRLLDISGQGVANKTITITINGENYTRTTDANGSVKININLNPGNYTATASYENQSVDADIIILSTIESNDFTKMFRNATQFEATFVDSDGNILKNANVTFNINGIFYTRKTNEKGIAKLNINLGPGKYIITVENPATSDKSSNNVTVLSTIIDNNDLTKYYKNASQYSVKLLDNQGNAVGAGEIVTFNINGMFYNRTTDALGIATLNINLPPSNYIITADYKGCKVSNNITVLPVLNATNITMKYLDGTQFAAKLVDGQGNPYKDQYITFNVNGILYNRLTDSSGVAKLNIRLIPGEYIITSSFNGANIANKITITS